MWMPSICEYGSGLLVVDWVLGKEQSVGVSPHVLGWLSLPWMPTHIVNLDIVDNCAAGPRSRDLGDQESFPYVAWVHW